MALPDPARSRAVLIGTSRFTDPELPDLPAVRNNLEGLAVCLRDPAWWGLPAAHCAVVADPDSVVALVDAVHDAATEAEDTLLVYYAGHGLIHPRTLGLLLALVGSTPGRTHTAVPYDLVRDNVIESPAARKVVILDCCYSGRALGGMADPTTAVADEASVAGTYLLASAPPNKQALSPVGETYTAFTGALLTLLNEGVPNGPELLRLDTIYRNVRDALRRASRPEPQLRVDNTAGELSLVRNVWRPAPHPALAFLPELVGGRYRVSPFGLYGTATIRAGTDTRTGRAVMLKRLPADLGKPHHKAVAVEHPGIVAVLDVVETIDDSGQSAWFVVSEHVTGRVLGDMLRRQGALKPFRAAEIVADVCDVVEYGHDNGVAHGDITADNVMLTMDNAVKVLNFGIGLRTGPLELLRPALDIWSDVRSAGLLLDELVTGIRSSAPVAEQMFVSRYSRAPGYDAVTDMAARASRGEIHTVGALRDDLRRLLA